LYFYVKELHNLGDKLPFGLVKTSRSSIYDVEEMKNKLYTYQRMFVKRTGYSIVGIPFILSKKEKNIKANNFGRMNRWMIDISVCPEWAWANGLQSAIKIENFEDIYKVFDYNTLGTEPVTSEVKTQPQLTSKPEAQTPQKAVDPGPSKQSQSQDEVDTRPQKAVYLSPPKQSDKQDLHPAVIPLPEPLPETKPKVKPLQTPQKPVDPSPIAKALDEAGLVYDNSLAPPGQDGITLLDHKNQFFGEVELNLDIQESTIKTLLQKMNVIGFKFEEVEKNYQLLACTIEGAITITNILTNGKYLAKTKEGKVYKNYKYFKNSLKKSDPTDQPLPQNGDGHGWVRVIDLLVARYEQEKSGTEPLKGSEFATEMYADVNKTPPSNDEKPIVTLPTSEDGPVVYDEDDDWGHVDDEFEDIFEGF
jgi:hypothetical protein